MKVTLLGIQLRKDRYRRQHQAAKREPNRNMFGFSETTPRLGDLAGVLGTHSGL